MLSDVAAMLTGSLGMLPSASLGDADPKTRRRKALYEPVHGSAPDIAGKGIANPIAMIGSFGMALRYSFGLPAAADRLDAAIAAVLASGRRTADIRDGDGPTVSTGEMGDAIVAELARSSGSRALANRAGRHDRPRSRGRSSIPAGGFGRSAISSPRGDRAR